MGQVQSSPNSGARVAEVAAEMTTTTTRRDESASAVQGADTKGTCPMKRADGNGYLFSWRNPHTAAFLAKAADDAQIQDPLVTVQTIKPQTEACPMKQGGDKVQKGDNPVQQYNVYSQPLDPNNNMPSVANQLPAPLQSLPLSTQRISSTIPKGGAADGETWQYPSSQMFYNALSRKHKLGDTHESDMDSVVSLHNNMNEKTWDKIVQWEQLVDPQQTAHGPKLLKFIGRPADLSPKARIKHVLFQYPLPFDRHDWTILRYDGTQVRYVIDYYFDESQASHSPDSALPSLHDRHSVKSILVDVRPALDSVSNLFQRIVKMPWARFIANSTKFEPLPLFPTGDLQKQVADSRAVWKQIQASVTIKNKDMVTNEGVEDVDSKSNATKAQVMTESQAMETAKTFALMLKHCQQAQIQVDQCTNDTECAKASLALTLCMGQRICPLQHETVTQIINKGPAGHDKAWNAQVDVTLENLASCVQLKSEQAALAKRLYPAAFERQC